MARETEATLEPLAREVVVEIIKRKLGFVSIIRPGRCQATDRPRVHIAEVVLWALRRCVEHLFAL
jgi:hypothetical protein